MLPTQTIYTVNADLNVLSAILNGVAMICSHNVTIWGFALLASVWKIVTLVSSAGFRSTQGGSNPATSDWISAFIPFLLAMGLTAPGTATDVQVESTINGKVTVVSNVPFIISVVPATISLLGQEVGQLVETAYQGTGTDYGSISASGHGFINPLKTLLTSRTAMLKLGGINSQINSIITSCISSDSGVNFATLGALVSNAGNTGATSLQSIPVFDLAGDAPTGIGALLKQASLNPNGMVPDIDVDGNDMVSCFDAAYKVADNINESLYSTEFARVIQGAVNASDQPNGAGDFSITGLSQQYLAVRTANTVTNTLAGGTQQANAELINMMFGELLRSDLNCLRADGADKTACLAATLQATEIERNNIQAAANGNEMLMYAGQFANYILAVIIGLGPVIIMFMMFSGINANKNMNAAVHMLVWPILIMNIGGEVINGIIYNNVATFMTTIAQSGYLSPAVVTEVYRNFSMQIGTASHLMATLPILMTTIFALGAGSAAIVRISDSMGSNSKKVGDAATPAPIDSTPIIRQSSPVSVQQGVGSFVAKNAGALDSSSIRTTMGDTQVTAGNALSNAASESHVISAATQQIKTVEEAQRSGKYESTGLDQQTWERLSDNYTKELSALQSQAARSGSGSSRTDAKATDLIASTQTSVGVGVPGGKKGIGFDASVTATAEARGSSTAVDNENSHVATDKEKSEALRRAAAKVLDEGKGRTSHSSVDKRNENTLANIKSAQTSYSDSLTNGRTITSTAETAVRESSGFVANTQNITADNFALQTQVNRGFQRFNVTQGAAFDNDAGNAPYLERARADATAGGVDRIGMNQAGQDALIRFRAAAMRANDPQADIQDRLKATAFLHDGVQAMEGMGLNSSAFADASRAPRDLDVAAPHQPASPVVSARPPSSHGGQGRHHVPAPSSVDLPESAEAAQFRTQNERSRQRTTAEVRQDVLHGDLHGVSTDGTPTRAGKQAVQAVFKR